jgi:hypothetical protein
MDNIYTPNENAESIEGWAFVEIFGHDKLAGRISTKKLGTAIMIQVDVPKSDTEFSHSELFNPSSIFSIKPTTEEWCRKFTEFQLKQCRIVIPYIPEKKNLIEPHEETDKENNNDGLDNFDSLLSPDDELDNI